MCENNGRRNWKRRLHRNAKDTKDDCVVKRQKWRRIVFHKQVFARDYSVIISSFSLIHFQTLHCILSKIGRLLTAND